MKPAKVASPYQMTLATVGGVQPVKWGVVGKLPPGLKLSQKTGAITGTPRQSGSFRMTVAARDALGAKARKKFALEVKS